MNDLFVRTWGTGTPVVLVHGSLATGESEWEAQRPLSDEGFRLQVVDRRGYGRSPSAEGEDFLEDARDIVDLVTDHAAHVVGHSYGGLGAMVAAATRPGSVRSLALLEPPVFTLARDDPAARALVEAVSLAVDRDLPDRDWLRGFLVAVGSDPATLPPEVVDEALPLVPLLRRARRGWDAELPLARLAEAEFPTLVVSGGHDAGFEAICDELAASIGASRAVVAGARHEVQLTGQPVNEALLTLWRRAG